MELLSLLFSTLMVILIVMCCAAMALTIGLESWDDMSARAREWVCGLTFGTGMTAATVYMFTL